MKVRTRVEILMGQILLVGILLVGIFTNRNLRIRVLVVSILMVYNLVLRKCNSPTIVINWSRVLLNRNSGIIGITYL